MNHLARVRVVQHTGFHLAAVARDICHISQIARQNVLAHIAPVAVVVGLAESEQIAVIAVAIGPVHTASLFNVSAAVPVAVYLPVISRCRC